MISRSLALWFRIWPLELLENTIMTLRRWLLPVQFLQLSWWGIVADLLSRADLFESDSSCFLIQRRLSLRRINSASQITFDDVQLLLRVRLLRWMLITFLDIYQVVNEQILLLSLLQLFHLLLLSFIHLDILLVFITISWVGGPNQIRIAFQRFVFLGSSSLIWKRFLSRNGVILVVIEINACSLAELWINQAIRARIIVEFNRGSLHLLINNILDLVDVFAFQILIEPILDLADSPANQRTHFRDLRPLRANLVEHLQNELVLLAYPVPPNDIRIEHVVPSLAALATQAAR